MNRVWQDRTARHVVIVLTFKLCLLTALWWTFVLEQRVEPDAGAVAAAVLRTAPDQRSPEPIP